MKIITEADLRTAARKRTDHRIRLEPDQRLTPSAMDYVREQGLELVTETLEYQEMGGPKCAPDDFVDGAGNHYAQKPEQLTHLRENLLVPKNHPRIVFRGRMDSLQAKILETQLTAVADRQEAAVRDLAELLVFARRILAAEVRETPLERGTLLGLGEEELRRVSHDPQTHYGVKHFLPSCDMGKMIIALNALRTAVRETELAAVDAFPGEQRLDLIRALNRLSSAVYIMMCRGLSEARRKGGGR